MMAVIADDLTGAAEMGGIALRHGLAPEIQTTDYTKPSSEVVVLDTDSRSGSPAMARKATRVAGELLANLEPQLVYKKVDSVMRGHILAELEALLPCLARGSALLVPANPSLGRTITKGRYYVRGRPLAQTDFSADPEHPIASSDVLHLLGRSTSLSTSFIEPGDPVPGNTVAVGRAESEKDLRAWAEQLDPSHLPAGGSEFFAALLQARGFFPVRKRDPEPLPQNGLFVCGSSSEYSLQRLTRASKEGLPVSRMPSELFRGDGPEDALLDQWTKEILDLLKAQGQAIATIGRPAAGHDARLAARLRSYTATLTKAVLRQGSVQELYVEGGATSSGVVRALGWNRFLPVQELAPGVVRMEVAGEEKTHLTIKPGSYPWPGQIWRGPRQAARD
jgi:uncharacterized protein YgbK (DUF1537 family)